MQGFGGSLSKAYLIENMLAGEAVSNVRTMDCCILCRRKYCLSLYWWACWAFPIFIQTRPNCWHIYDIC